MFQVFDEFVDLSSYKFLWSIDYSINLNFFNRVLVANFFG